MTSGPDVQPAVSLASENVSGRPPFLRNPGDLREHSAAHLVPPLRSSEYDLLKRDIQNHGIKVPLTVVGDVVLDGRHRLRIAIELKLESVPVCEANLTNGETEIERLLKGALFHRQLRDDQRAMIGAIYAREHPKARGRTGKAGPDAADSHPVGGTSNHHQPPAQLAAAAFMNVSPKRVEKAAQILSKDPDLSVKVHHGELSIGRALRMIDSAKIALKLPPLPKGAYQVIYSEFLWNRSVGASDGAEDPNEKFKDLSVKEMSALGIRSIVDHRAALFLWVPCSMLETCWRLIHAWGFRFKTVIGVHDIGKPYIQLFGHGRYGLFLACTRGDWMPDVSIFSGRSNAKRRDITLHVARDVVAQVCPDARRLELFPKSSTLGWESYPSDAAPAVGAGDAG